MSLYCFGKIELAPNQAVSFAFPGEVVVENRLDDEDIETINSIDNLGGDGIYFSFRDNRESVDATMLWIEAMDRFAGGATDSRLGKAIYSLLFDPLILTGAVAFVDGGIEVILEGTPEQCWSWFLELIKKPWDAIDNPIMVWHRQNL